MQFRALNQLLITVHVFNLFAFLEKLISMIISDSLSPGT
jgi:hypothetical protein